MELKQQSCEIGDITSWQQILGGLVHELNNPVNIMQHRIYKLKSINQNSVDGEKITDCVEKMEEALQRVSRIIQCFLCFTKNARREEFQNVLLEDLVQDVLKFSENHHRYPNIPLILPKIPIVKIECNPIQISQALINLLNNALDAISEMKSPWVKIDFILKEFTIEISITDSGNGIPPEILPRIMEPFFTTKKSSNGTGLGLSIAKMFLEEHSASIKIDPECKNTRFIVELPYVQRKEKNGYDTLKSNRSSSTDCKNILG